MNDNMPGAITSSIFIICFFGALTYGCHMENQGMSYYELQAYENYIESCNEQGLTPEPPYIYRERKGVMP